jgi:hypothetical protein
MWDNVFFREVNGKIIASASTNGCGCCSDHRSQGYGDEDFLSKEDIEGVLAYHQNCINEILKYKDAWLKQEGKI